MYPQAMPDTEEAEPATGRTKSLSTAVDEDTYDWFVQHAKDNFRDRSGQLAFILAEYRKRVEAQERIRSGEADPAAFGRALLQNLAEPRRVPRPIRAGEPYTGSVPPGTTVTWDENPPAAHVPLGDEPHPPAVHHGPGDGSAWLDPETDDDPDEGVS